MRRPRFEYPLGLTGRLETPPVILSGISALAQGPRALGLLLAFACLAVSLNARMPTFAQDVDQLLTLEAAAARKAAIQTRLGELDSLVLSDDEREEARDRLGQILAALTAFESASQRRHGYEKEVAGLPQRMQEAVEARRQLESRSPSRFPGATQLLRAQYDARRQALEDELNDLITQKASDAARLAGLPEEIREHGTALRRLERQRQESEETIREDDQQVSNTELSDIRVQAQRARIKALEAERRWLIERGPLQEALVGAARLRLNNLRGDLRLIQASLETNLREQRENLNRRVFRLQQRLSDVTHPSIAIPIRARLQTATTERETIGYRHQIAGLRQDMRRQEALNNEIRRDISRLVSHARQYAGSERVVQRLLVKFERLRREHRAHATNVVGALPVPAPELRNPQMLLRERLESASEALSVVDDRLYVFDRDTDNQLERLTAAVSSSSPNERVGALSSLRADLEAQRAALREQQQVLTELTQTLAQLIILNQEHGRLIGDGFRLVLSRVMWLKNSDALGWGLAGDAAAQALSLASRAAAGLRMDVSRLWSRLKGNAGPWGLLIVLFVGMPVAAHRFRLRLSKAIRVSLSVSGEQGAPPPLLTAVLLALHAVTWPAWLAILLASRQLLLVQPGGVPVMAAALVSGGFLAAIILAIGCIGQTLFRPGGWGQNYWRMEDEGRRLCQHTFRMACAAGLLFLVPREIVLIASPDPLPAGGQTLERLLLLAFQTVAFLLVLRAGWPTGPLMAPVLARNRDGFLWRLWPFFLIIPLVGLAGVMILDVLGYRYTAQFILLHGVETVSIVLGSRIMLVLLVTYGVQRLVRVLCDPGGRWHDTARQHVAERSLLVFRFVSQLLLTVVALLLILEIWGVSVWGVVNSDTGSQIMGRALVALAAIAGVVVVIRISDVLAEYIVRPRLSAQGETRELGRKLRTLTPLVQTVIKVAAMLIGILVVLEQINVRTGPLLAGLGLFGLAVGLASQSLIKDVINGLFILFEDSISVGDVATLRGISGVVEKITLRSIVLRDLQGDVHVIPNSTIDLVTNMTKVYSRYVLDVGVAYREDVDTVMEILRKVDADMRQDLRYGYNMLEPIEIWGVDRFADSAVYVRARLKTRPGKQWEVGREFNRRMKKVFDERGIEIPFPHRTLYWGGSKGAPPVSNLLPASDLEG